jgi:hypothetical protein
MKIDWLSHRSFAAVPMLGFGLMLRSMQAFHTTRKTLGADLVLAGVLSLGAAVTFLGAQAQAFPQDPPCPTDALAPFGISPGPNAPTLRE